MDAGTAALSQCDARESAAKVKVVRVGDAAGPAVSGYSVREVLKNSTPHPSSRGEGGLDPLSHNLLQKV